MDCTPEAFEPRPSSSAGSVGTDGLPLAALNAAAVRTVLTQVRAAAEAIDLRLEPDAGGELLRGCLPMPGGREQQVFVRVSGLLAQGLHVVTFFSPCHRVPEGEQLAPDLMRRLLLVNEQHRFVRLALWPMDDGELVVASWDQIVETMEAEELGTQVRALAVVADRLEQQLDGSDRF